MKRFLLFFLSALLIFSFASQILTAAVSFADDAEADEAAEQIITGYVSRSGIKLINRDSSDAYYSPSTDTVVLPLLAQFDNTAE